MYRMLLGALLVCACARESSQSDSATGSTNGGPAADAGTDGGIDAGTVAPNGEPGDAGMDGVVGTGTSWSPSADGDPELIDPQGQFVYAISPDGDRVLLARHLLAWDYTGRDFVPGTGDMFLAVRGAETMRIAKEGMYTAEFSDEGNAIVIRTRPHGLMIMRADGDNGRRLTTDTDRYILASQWLYWEADSASGNVQLLRLNLPDGNPEVVVASLPDHTFWVDVSPDGQMVEFCDTSLCHLVPADGSWSVSFPFALPTKFSSDSKWLWSGCDLYDRSGAMHRFCDPNRTPWGGILLSPDGKKFAIVGASMTRVITLATMSEEALPGLSSAFPQTFAPDGSRLIASRTSQDARSGGLWVISTDGGDWIQLSNDVYSQKGLASFPVGLAFSPDSRVVATTSISQGVVESVAGGPTQVVTDAGEKLFYATPVFEPAGGSGKAVFYTSQSGPGYQQAMANADGSGEWIDLGLQYFAPQWIGHSLLSEVPRPTGPDGRNTTYDVLVTTDDASLVKAPLVSGVNGMLTDRSPEHPAMYFNRSDGTPGLYRIAVPQSAP